MSGRRKAVALAAGGALAAVAAGALYAASTDGGAPARAATRSAGRATATVERTTLEERETFDATLGYADARAVVAQGSGTVTWLAPEGAVARRGEALFRVDGAAVHLLYGATPAWRTLSEGVGDGVDVEQLERNLVALGYDPYDDVDVDREFDWATTAAVKRWQDDLGRTEDGVVELGEVVFLPGARRVGEHRAEAGRGVGPGAEVMETSSTARVATFDVDADRRGLVAEGDRVTVRLPDGATARGIVTRVGTVARSGGDDEPVVPVEVALRGDARAAFDQAPVEVDVVGERRRCVLVVPVSALLALAEGGYALEVVDGARTELVAVEPGLYSDGFVEVSGDGLRAGLEVVVAE